MGAQLLPILLGAGGAMGGASLGASLFPETIAGISGTTLGRTLGGGLGGALGSGLIGGGKGALLGGLGGGVGAGALPFIAELLRSQGQLPAGQQGPPGSQTVRTQAPIGLSPSQFSIAGSPKTLEEMLRRLALGG